MSNYVLQIDRVNHTFRRDSVLKEISLVVEPGQIVCLLGPSGCGKTTLLRIIAGLLTPTQGRVFIEGVDQANIPTFRRNLGFVFQDAALFPHLNLFHNVAFPFTRGGRRLPNEDSKKAVARILQTTNLSGLEHRNIANLSGGQLQRVALARALVYRPSLLLLDEPLSSLDNSLKDQLLDLLLTLHNEYGTSFLYVTHDEREALRIGTHIAVIDDEHELRQFGTVTEVVTQPATKKVAKIVGGWNILPAKVAVGKPKSVELASGDIIDNLDLTLPEGSSLDVGIPTHAIELTPNQLPIISDRASICISITRSAPWYEGWMYEGIIGPSGSTQKIVCFSNHGGILTPGSVAFINFKKEDVYAFE
jgi:ABC-type Fe3+/spermidine/putrescine transport system ATPase subunit